MSDESILDVLAALAKRRCEVVDAVDTVLLTEHIVEKTSSLFVIVVRVLMGVPSNLA